MSGTTARRLAGIVQITINGNSYNASDVTWNPSTVARSDLIDQTGPSGFKIMPVFGMISATIRDAGDITISDFNTMENATVVIQQANGKQIFGSGMFNIEVGEVNTTEGQVKVTFHGTSVSEAVAT